MCQVRRIVLIEVAAFCIARVEGDFGGGVPDHVGQVVVGLGLLVINFTGSGGVLSLPVKNDISIN